MFKTSFTAAILAACASAANEGNNYDNIVTYELIADQLNLRLYNSYLLDDGEPSNVLRGELVWTDSSDGAFFFSNIREMGFCFREVGTTFWDCNRTRFNVDPKDAAARNNFAIEDGYSRTDLSGYVNDNEQGDYIGGEWVADKSRSSMVGCTANSDVADSSNCTSVTSVFARYFDTFQDQDIELADSRGSTYRSEDMTDEEYAAKKEEEDAAHIASLEAALEKEFEAMGWHSVWSSSDYQDGTEQNRVESSAAVKIQPVFPAYVAAVKAGTAEANNAPEGNNDGGDGGDGGEDNTNKDGATAVTTFAASVMAVICSLAF